jgi:hypothetical protein
MPSGFSHYLLQGLGSSLRLEFYFHCGALLSQEYLLTNSVLISVSFTDEFSPNFDIYKGFFREKNDSNSLDFEESFFQITRFL